MKIKLLALFLLATMLMVLPGRAAFAQYEDEDLFEDEDDTASDMNDTQSPLDDAALEEDSSPLDEPSYDDGGDIPIEAGGAGSLGSGDGSGIGGLLLTRNTMQFGGSIGLQIDSRKFEYTETVINPLDPTQTAEIPRTQTDTGGYFNFSPAIGWFVIDGLELLLDFNLAIPFGDLYDGDPNVVGFNMGARYIFDFRVICLYVGAKFGFNFSIEEEEVENPLVPGEFATISDTVSSFLISVPVGILVPFNRHVALDVGISLDLDIGIGDNPLTLIHFPIGYLGIQGFFNFFG
jgi:hypothetical protein